MRKKEKVLMGFLVLLAEFFVAVPIVLADIPAPPMGIQGPYYLIIVGLGVGVIVLISWLALRRIRKNRIKNDDNQ